MTWRTSVEDARRHVAAFRAGPVDIVPAREPLVLEAALLKAQHPMSYADAFAVATTRLNDAKLITGDPEILGLPRSVVRTVPLEREARHS